MRFFNGVSPAAGVGNAKNKFSTRINKEAFNLWTKESKRQ